MQPCPNYHNVCLYNPTPTNIVCVCEFADKVSKSTSVVTAFGRVLNIAGNVGGSERLQCVDLICMVQIVCPIFAGA